MEVITMKNNMKIETLLSMIVNIVLGSLVFAYLSANASVTAATVAGIVVVIMGAVFSFSFPKLVSKAN